MITNDTVKYIASLSRLHIDDADLSRFGGELQNILQYVDKLSELDVSNVPPTSHVFRVENVFREDTILPSLSPVEAFSFAIESHDGHYKVPKVIE